jgi:hypothetical protein
MHYAVVPHGRSAVGWNGVPGRTSLHAPGCDCYGCCEAYGASAGDFAKDTATKTAGQYVSTQVGGLITVVSMAAGVTPLLLVGSAAGVALLGYGLFLAYKDDKADDAEAIEVAVAMGVPRKDAKNFGDYLENAAVKWDQKRRKEELKDLNEKIRARDAKEGKYAVESAFVTEDFYQATTRKRRRERDILKIIVDSADGKGPPDQAKVKEAVAKLPTVTKDPKTGKRVGQFTLANMTPAALKSVGGRDAEEGPFGLQSSYGGVDTRILIALAAAGAGSVIYRATRTRP